MFRFVVMCRHALLALQRASVRLLIMGTFHPIFVVIMPSTDHSYMLIF